MDACPLPLCLPAPRSPRSSSGTWSPSIRRLRPGKRTSVRGSSVFRGWGRAKEIVALDPATVERWLHEEPELSFYRFLLESTLRQKPHVRSVEVESLLAQSIEIGR